MNLLKILFGTIGDPEATQYNGYDFFTNGINSEKPKPKVSSSSIPQSYLDNTKVWDSHLFENQSVVNDTK